MKNQYDISKGKGEYAVNQIDSALLNVGIRSIVSLRTPNHRLPTRDQLSTRGSKQDQ